MRFRSHETKQKRILAMWLVSEQIRLVDNGL
jgi:hypothetical protein